MKFKAEDWLTNDDSFQGNQPEGRDNRTQVEEKEIKLAKKILAFLTSLQARGISMKDKQNLRRDIELSLLTEKRNASKTWIPWAAAAVLLIGFSAAWLFYQTSHSPIEQFAHKLENQDPADNTTLILGNKKEIVITDKESEISYEAKSNKIEINRREQVEITDNQEAQTYHSVIVPYGKRSQIDLSDGTKVWLNSGTKLVFPSIFKNGKREVYLQGEAIFDVAHLDNSSFYVKTDDFSVKVLGTVFNISAYADDESSSAVLKRGQIEISSNRTLLSGRGIVMEPSTMAVYQSANKSFITSKVNPDEYLSWREGYLTLNKWKLENIVKKLSRYYDKEIILKDQVLKNETFTGFLDLKNSPVDVLEIISRMVPLTIEETNDKLIIKPKLMTH